MASDPKTWIWERARTILDEAERIEREMLRVRVGSPSWMPAVDVLETCTDVWVLAAVPGVEEAAIEVSIDGSEILITGVRSTPAAFHGAIVHRLEIPRGRFARRVALPPGRYELAQRVLKHGCLALNFRKID